MNNIADFEINDRGWLVGYNGSDKEVTVPEGVVGLDNWAFSANPHIESITVPGFVKSVSYKSIVGCDNLKKVIFEDGVERIGSIAVSLCPRLEYVSIPDSILDMDKEWLYDCPNIRYNFDGAVKYLGNESNPYAVLAEGDKSLAEYSVKAGCRIILDEAFDGAEALGRVSFPDGIRVICFSAFRGCTHLSKVSFGEELCEIESCAFDRTVIKEVKLPKSLKKIGWNAFGCPLEKISIQSDICSVGKDSLGYGDLVFNEYEGGKYLGCEDNPYVILTEVADKNTESFKVHKDTVIIGSCAFSDCVKLCEIELPEGIVTIGDGAFKNCYKLEKINFPSTLNTISDSAFFCCFNLCDIKFPEGEIAIGSHAFCSCESLEEVVLENASVGDNAFAECTALETVKVGENCNLWGDYIFAWSFRLKKAILAEKFKDRLGDDAFEDCIDVEIEYV